MEENKDMNLDNGVDKESFANVNFGVSDEEAILPEEKNKVKRPTVLACIIAIVLGLLTLVIFGFFALKGKDEVGLGNRFNSSIGVIDGDWLYHSDINGTMFMKTNVRNGETSVLAEKSVAFFNKYKGDLYYYDALKEEIYKIVDGKNDSLVYSGSAYYHQFYNDYIYFLEPNSSYGGIVKRVSVKGGEAETVLNVNCSTFAISGKNIIYYDPSINQLLINKLSKTIKAAKEGEITTSSEIMSVVLAEKFVGNISVSGKDLYFNDASDNFTLYKLDLSDGRLEKINHGVMAPQFNIFGDYIFYIDQANKHLMRMNLDGSDIKAITGGEFQEVAGIALYKDKVLFYALAGEYDENLQMQTKPVIVVRDFDGEFICSFNPETLIEEKIAPEISIPEEEMKTEEAQG